MSKQENTVELSARANVAHLERMVDQYEHTAQTIRGLVKALKAVMNMAETLPAEAAPKRKSKKRKRTAHMSPEARAKMSAMMKARWADKRAGVGKVASKRPTQGGKRGAPGKAASNVSSESAS